MKDTRHDDEKTSRDESTMEGCADSNIDIHSDDVSDNDEIELLAPPSLVEDSEEPTGSDTSSINASIAPTATGKMRNKIFEKYTSRDIVFLSIMAGCMLITSAIMPLALSLHMFGVIHLMLGFQLSFFPALGLMKVRKVGALLYMTTVFSLVPLFIMPPIALGGIVCALITELVVVAIFRGFHKDIACIVGASLFFPMSLPLMYGYYHILYGGKDIVVGKGEGEIREAVAAMINVEPGFAIGISVAVIAICVVGALLGALTYRRLVKAGAIKK